MGAGREGMAKYTIQISREQSVVIRYPAYLLWELQFR